MENTICGCHVPILINIEDILYNILHVFELMHLENFVERLRVSL